MSENEEEQIALQFVSDKNVGLLAPMNGNYNIKNVPNQVLENIFKIAVISSTILFLGNICHAYQKLYGVITLFRAVMQDLIRMLPISIKSVQSR